jgi:hypothetical protein
VLAGGQDRGFDQPPLSVAAIGAAGSSDPEPKRLNADPPCWPSTSAVRSGQSVSIIK